MSTAATNVNVLFTHSGAKATNTSGDVDLQLNFPSRLFTITNNVQITNVTAPTSVFSNLLGSATLPANFWKPGMVVEAALSGRYWMGAGNLQQSNEMYYGAVLLATNHMPYFAASGAGDEWTSQFTITCLTVGASGTLHCQGWQIIPSTVNGVSGVTKMFRLATGSGIATVDTTASTALDYKFHPGATTTALWIHSGFAHVTP